MMLLSPFVPRTRWAILTGEYSPQPGGVADYTALVAAGLVEAGDAVTVYAPPSPAGLLPTAGVEVVRLPDHYGPRGLAALDSAITHTRPNRVLIQYVPHAFGFKALNLLFAAWVATRAKRAAPVWVMFHEVRFPFAWRYPHAVLAPVHAAMARLVAGAAERVFVSVPQWAGLLRRLAPRSRPGEWLPVPSNIPVAITPRMPASGDQATIGHFGTYGPAVVPLLEPSLAALLAAATGRTAALLGRGGPAFADGFSARHPALASRVSAHGELPASAVSERLRTCDILLQPYIDGVTCRRTSVMAGLANGVPVVTNLGPLSEPVWQELACLAFAARPHSDEIVDAAETVLALGFAESIKFGELAAAIYQSRFGIERTIAKLRGEP